MKTGRFKSVGKCASRNPHCESGKYELVNFESRCDIQRFTKRRSGGMALGFSMRLPTINFAPKFSAHSKNFGMSFAECWPSPSNIKIHSKCFSAANFHPARKAAPLPEFFFSETISTPKLFAVCAVASLEPSSTTMITGRNFFASATTFPIVSASLKQGITAAQAVCHFSNRKS